MDQQPQTDPGQQTVLEEIASRLGQGVDRPFAHVDLLYGYLFRPESGRWRLYLPASPDYLEGSEADMGAMRTFLTPSGDTLLWVRVGADLVTFQDGERSAMVKPVPTTSWCPRLSTWLRDTER
jgi:hypothetical protein